MSNHAKFESITQRVIERSKPTRARYLEKIEAARRDGPERNGLSCSNLAHGIAAFGREGRKRFDGDHVPNIAIVSAYNEMLSAHQPFETFPARIKKVAAEDGAIAQFAGGVPAMCDGVTQGQDGMDLSLFSRDVIALSTAVALSHNMFDATICLGVCDKIVPGLMIGALAFGHLPTIFAPAGPMVSGLSNKEKARTREDYASGKIGREALLEAECAAYHSPGTCTFYGTANSNQMLMEFMGLQLPGGSFVNPGTALRDALTDEATRTLLRLTNLGDQYRPIGHIVDEKAIINAMVGLLATGGSTNHTLHLVAIAAAAGVVIDWQDFDELSRIIPLMARVYPNGTADVNHFHAAGGLGFVIGDLLAEGLLHDDVKTILGDGLSRFAIEPFLAAEEAGVEWRPAKREPLDTEILRPAHEPFDSEGGLRLVDGNVGRAVVKVSAVDPSRYRISAPARVFDTQQAFKDAFNAGELEMDVVVVVPFQGPKANGMPELHKLTPYLGVLQNRGFKVALVTDGRMSGASGKVLSGIQLTPEAIDGGAIARIRDGDIVTLDANSGELIVELSEEDLANRECRKPDLSANHSGMGRELFTAFRLNVAEAEKGAGIFGDA